jgi:hypothetical protein
LMTFVSNRRKFHFSNEKGDWLAIITMIIDEWK